MSTTAEILRESGSDSSNWRLDSAKMSQTSMQSKKSISDSSPVKKSQSEVEDCNKEHGDNNSKLCGSSESLCNEDSKYGCGKTSGCANSCSGCHCRCTTKRRCSSSDIKSLKASEQLLTTLARKSSLVSNKSDKVDKINLANLVFNPNFKTNDGCVNLPVIRAGQNLAQKNAQRKGSTDLGQLSQKEAIDLIAQQLQKQQTNKLNEKIQKLVGQKGNASSSGYSSEESSFDVGEIIQSMNSKSITPSQNNAARYKTELCRSYQEGGECRFGAACTFAHGPEELRPVPRHPLYKTELCRTYHQHGYCQYGTRCHFIHDADEADKNAPLKGCKSWGRHDQLSGALLSLASSSGILDSNNAAHTSSSDNDVLLANLRRLYALRNLNSQEKENQFSASQPLSQQLSMAHQQFSSTQPHPMSMTQPLPMEALQMGLHRATARGSMGHMGSNNRLESIANDYANWGIAPQSPTYPGLSPFGSYQQFSPLPPHPSAAHHHPHPHQSYPQYPFSATAPDLSAALNVSPYAMSPPTFSNTVNVGHMLPDQNGNFPPHSGSTKSSAGSHQHGGVGSSMNGQQMWPQTSAEVSSTIDRELFGFGLDGQSQQVAQNSNGYQQFQPPYFQSASQYGGAYHQAHPGQHLDSLQQAKSAGNKVLSTDSEILNFINSERYRNSDGSKPQGLKTIREVEDARQAEQSVRPKMIKSRSSSSTLRTDIQTEL